MPKSTRVEILGQIYTLRGEEGDEKELEELAAYVDDAMRQVASGTTIVDTLRIAILAAVHLTHELFQARRELERMKQEVDRRAGVLGAALSKVIE